LGSSASVKAAQIQANAAEYAANLQNQQFQQTQQNIAPWLQAGQLSLGQLSSGLQPGGQFVTPYSGTFTPPTLADVQNEPGYQFTQQQGEQGIERGQAASGGAFTGGTLKSLDAFNTGLADTTYNNAYQRALQTFQTQFNTYNTNQSNAYNRLAGVSGTGQTSAVQLGQLGQQAAAQQGNDLTSAAAAQAAGVAGSAIATNSGIGGVANAFGNYLTLQQLAGTGPQASPAIYNPAMLTNNQTPSMGLTDLGGGGL